MSGFGGFGGFGQNNNNQQQQSSGFGGFGSNTNTTSGFGSTTGTAFGASNNTTGGSLFGGGSTGGGFGNSGGFGNTTQSSAFGAPAKPAFGSTTTTSGGGLFGGGNTATAGSGFGGGGFGQSQQSNTAGFGGSGGLFGGAKPATSAFGTAAPASTNAFGGGSTGFGGFGSTTTPASTALGGPVGECQGTGSVPFQPFVEKEPNSASNQQNSFQSIGFQQPYQKYSPEELRLADYTQGRRYGNSSNQPGAFGTNSNFGGFGNNNQASTTGFGGSNTTTGGGLFGGGSTSGFGGTSQPQSNAFGGGTATSGGLFGQKPATGGGLFGGQSQAPASGSLFGGSGTTGFGGAPAANTGFGGTNTATGSSLFGGANNAAAKPAFSFGTTPASSGSAFGGTPATTFGGGTGLFGGNSGSGFGQQPQQPQPAAGNPFGSFGQNNQQQQAGSTLFGGAKPASTGLFGGAPAQPAAAGGGLFGGAQPAANPNPFGTSTNTGTTNTLFGTKPPATGSTLFGGSQNTQNNNAGGGLFGGGFGGQNQNQPQQQQNTGGGLFGGLGNNAQKSTMFGGAQTQQQPGNSLFGNTGTQQGGGLFSSTNQQSQQPQQGLGNFGANSLFGGPQQNQNQNQLQLQGTPQAFTTSINDPQAYGTSLFSQLGNSQNITNPGPLATPLSSAKAKKSAALPLYKLNPSSSSRFSTPAKRGFGFSYSNYGSPSSVSSAASTPGASFNNSLLGGSLSRGLSKSVSTSSLRRTYNTEDSILAPGAFSAGPAARHFGSTGSMKRIVINKNLRGDLFSPPQQEKPQQPPQSSQSSQLPSTPTGRNGRLTKRVSFSSTSGDGTSNTTNGASTSVKPSTNSEQPANGNKPNGTTSQPEMEQVRSTDLAIVPEEEPAATALLRQPSQSTNCEDPEPGEYWTRPSREALGKMSRNQLEHVKGFTVGRHGIGQVTFDREVNLTKINIDEVCGGLIILEPRSCTVYPVIAKKPPVGHGLNVPSTICLLNSWPRSKDKRSTVDKSGPRIKKHIDRLNKVPETKFVSYDVDQGIWTFTVDHFTTYALDDEDDETELDGVNDFGQSTLSGPPDTPTPMTRTPKSPNYDDSFASTQLTHTESDPEDTFQFRNKKKVLPGAFDEGDLYDEDMEGSFEQEQQSFLDERSVGSQSEDGVEEPMDQDDVYENESVSIAEQEMAGSFPLANNTAEQDDYSQDDEEMEEVDETPGGAMRARMRALKNQGTPLKRFNAGDDWAATLQNTISPKKQDRALLKSLIDIHGNDSRPDVEPAPVPRNRVVSDGQGFATSIDLMNSLFGQTRSPTKVAKVPAQSKGFEWPYAKRPKTADNDTSNMTEDDRAFHDSMKPSWGPDGTLVYAVSSNAKPYTKSSRRARDKDGLLDIQQGGVVSESRDVRFAKFSNEASADALKNHKALAVIDDSRDVPFATLPNQFSFHQFFDDRETKNPASLHEKLVWQLAGILFDHIDVPADIQDVPNVIERLRKDKVSVFWEKVVDHASTQQAIMIKSNEDKAIAALSGHRVADACGHLLGGKNFHLATLVAQIGGKESMRKDMRQQLQEWHKSKIVSEFSLPIRTLYEILAGNVCVCDGSKGGPVEDRVESYVISKRFGLDWRQAFGLRLWYGILAGDDISVAVQQFAEDLSQNKETSRPQTWYVEQKVPTLWEDKSLDDREDLLWGLLRLYTFQDADLEAIIRPENSQLSPLDTRLSWQLSRALTATGEVRYSVDGNDKADQATFSFASQLTNEGSWLDAVFVLLHLSSDEARAKSIREHLAHHAGRIGTEETHSFTTLATTFKIPTAWIWEAKALYMRSVKKDPRGEVDCLIKARLLEEAHRTFTKDVAPKSVIERDYGTLQKILDGLDESVIPDWHLGGEIYQDFLDLLSAQKSAEQVDYTIIDRLLSALPAVVEDSRHPGFMETVAVEIMSAVVAKAVAAMARNGDKSDLPKILRLPLTEDNYLKHTVDLSISYYRDVMAGGR